MRGADLLNAVRSTITTEGIDINYADRIPEATKENLAEVGKALFSYEVGLNEFLNQLINRIGLVYVQRKSMKNKLAILKRGKLEYGDSIEELYVDLARAVQYYPQAPEGNNCDVYAQHKPEIVSAFHKVNRENVYPVTINETMLKRAFTSYDKFDSFISAIFDSIYNADQVDEFILFKQLIGSAVRNSYLVKVDKPVASDKNTATQFSIQMRAYGLALEYVSRKYNQAQVATQTDLADQILFLRSDIVPVIDVLELSNAFNLNLAQPISGRIIVIDDFGSGNDDIIGAIADKDISMIYDTLYRTESVYNPLHLYWNYFLHHHQIISSSPFANCIGFTTETITPEVKSVTIEPKEITIPTGYSNTVRAYVDFVGEVDTSVTWTLTGNDSDNTTVVDGKITIGADETAETVTVTAASVAKSTLTDSITVTIVKSEVSE